MTCNLYVIEVNGFFKVGISKDLTMRLNQLSTACPYDPEVIEVFEFDSQISARNAEKIIHEELKSLGLHKKLEWFRSVDVTDILDVCRECSDLVKKSLRDHRHPEIDRSIKILSICDPMLLSGKTGIPIGIIEKYTSGDENISLNHARKINLVTKTK